MATLKTCLAVVNDFTAEDFAALEAKARDYAGGKSLTNTHFIKAAQDAIATLKDDIKAIESGVEQEAPAPAPAPAEAPAPAPAEAAAETNADVTANTPVDPVQERKDIQGEINKLDDRGADSYDLKRAQTALEKGDFEAARNIIKAIKYGLLKSSDVGARAARRMLERGLDKLNEAQLATLQTAYQAQRGSRDFFEKLEADVVRYLNEGAAAVKAKIRAIIRNVALAVAAVGVVFNPTVQNDAYATSVQSTLTQAVAADTTGRTATKPDRATVPTEARAKMSELAISVYEKMAPVATKSGKGFIIADKPNGMIHVFDAKGNLIVQDSALYGKEIGDELQGKKKITPAGKFTMVVQEDPEYAGGYVISLQETLSVDGLVAIHAAYLGDPKENRTARLASPTASDNRISYGCVNTSHETFLKKILPRIQELNGGMTFVLPDNQKLAEALFNPDQDAAQPANRYRINEKPRGVLKSDLVKWIYSITSEWKNAPPIIIVQSESELPQAIQDEINSQDLSGRVPGLFNNGKVYLIGNNINGAKDAALTLAHEATGHYGLRGVLGNSFEQVMLQIYNGNAKIREAADAKMRASKVKKETAVEEALADLQEQPENRPLIKRVIGLLRTALNKILGKVADSFTDDQVQDLLWQSRVWVRRGEGAANLMSTSGSVFRPGTTAFDRWFGDSKVVDAKGKPLVVYHGMPGEMEGGVFRESSYGSLGRGIYFTSDPEAAGRFATGVRGSTTEPKVQGSTVPVYLKLEQPFDDEFFVGNKPWQEWAASVLSRGYDTTEFRYWTSAAGRDLNGSGKAAEALHDKLMRGEATIRDLLFLNGTSESGWGQEILEKIKAHGGFDGVILKDSPKGFDEYVVFKPTQVKSAIGNSGAYDPTNPDIRFRTAPAAMQAMAEKMAVNNLGRARRGLLSSTFLRDLESRFKDRLAGVADYVKGTFDMSATAADIQERAKEVDDAINALPDAQRKELMEFMADATAANVVVEETKDRDNNHLSRIETNARGESVRVFEPVVKEIQDKFARLSDKQKAAYRQARDALAANWKKRGELLERTANDIYKPLIEEAQRQGNEDRVNELKRQRNGFISDTNARLNQIKGDYFPMSRFGEWVVVRKSAAYEKAEKEVDDTYDALEALYNKYEKHTPEQRKAIAEINRRLKAQGAEVIGEYTEEEAKEIKAARDKYNNAQTKLEGLKPSETDYYVAQFESEGEARAHAKSVGGTAFLKRENSRELSPISRTMLSKLEESLAATMKSRGNVTALVDAKRAMYQVFLQTLPERSALMRQAKRKNIAGFDRDMQRSIASVMLKDSFYLSRMEHGETITEALNTAYKDAQDKKDIELQEVHNELAKRLAVSMRYVDTPIQDAIAGLTYIWQLGVSPGYLIANMVQPFTVSVPMMSARHGMRAAASFAKAWGDTAKIVTASLKGNVRGEINFKNAGLPADEVEMLDQMLRGRLLNVTLVADLARTADGQPTSKFASLMAKPSHFVEVVNRMSSALAAYRLEKPKTGKDAAVKYASRVLADTHFDYSAENAPYWMKPGALPMSKVAFQFKKYQAGMISLFVKAAAAMATGSKTEKREAMAQVTGMLATHLAIGGALGLPAVGTLLFIANVVARAFGDDEEPWDAEVALRNTLSDSFGPEAGRVLAKGLPTLLGADLSQKVGVGDLLNPVPTLRSDKQGRDFALELLATLAGPFFGGVLPGWFDAASYFAKGDFVKGVEKSVPKWVADPIRAGRFLDEGVTTKQGTVALDREAISAWDASLQAAGLPSATITESYEARAAIEAQKKGLNDRVGRYKKDWLEAKNDGDEAAAREIWDEIRTKVNPARVRNGLPPITMGDLLRFRQERKKLEGKYAKVGGNTNPEMGQIARFAQ